MSQDSPPVGWISRLSTGIRQGLSSLLGAARRGLDATGLVSLARRVGLISPEPAVRTPRAEADEALGRTPGAPGPGTRPGRDIPGIGLGLTDYQSAEQLVMTAAYEAAQRVRLIWGDPRGPIPEDLIFKMLRRQRRRYAYIVQLQYEDFDLDNPGSFRYVTVAIDDLLSQEDAETLAYQMGEEYGKELLGVNLEQVFERVQL